MTNIYPVILAGGSGTRLWPVSRKSFPKQFSNFLGEPTLFQKTVLRMNDSDTLKFSPILTITNEDYRFIVAEQIQSLKIELGHILVEPESKNTAPAILAATIFASQQEEDPILLVCPSDHLIRNINEFHSVVLEGMSAVNRNNIVTFGVKPSRPETNYGYIEIEKLSANKIHPVNKFVEKPNIRSVQKMIQNDKFLWNAGIFMFRASDMIEVFKKHAYDLLKNVEESLMNSRRDLSFMRLETISWAKCRNVSIDYAIMEKANNLVACQLDAGWADLGGWNAVWQEMGPDENGVSKSQNAHEIDCVNSLLRSENTQQQIFGLGLRDIVAVATKDAVLVASKSKLTNNKNIISELRVKKIEEAENFEIDYRPWGHFEVLTSSEKFKVKRIMVKPGESLSLQSHKYRSEHWVIVKGSAKIIINQKNILLKEGQSVYIPKEAVHRLSNPGKIPLILIEVQIGSYLKEDDIVRYEDKYSRE